uniref:NADH dehydrogenase subunit 3 n=1 Tax=Erianthus versicolor TaxID=470935 RepID=UPI00241191EB|nr:NADH dehydrogenase subunit 3 [Erianthus versicolor]WEL32788.1 NADH dehydrogenase subunit 3 [Erianthus versicolor]
MINLTTAMLMSLMITLIIIMMNMSMSKKLIYDREKSSPFECGFDPNSSSRMPFSLRFFMIAVIFLIFDVEIVMILPIPVLIYWSSLKSWIISSSLFIMILIMGCVYEWKVGALQWEK